MKKRIYLVVVMGITLLFSIFIWLALDGSLPIEVERAWTLYIIAKGVSLALLVWISIYVLLKKEFSNNDVVLALITVVFQITPLLLRLVLKGNDPKYSLAAVISFLSVTAYFIGFALLDLSNDKRKKELEENK
ncbi:MAG: hypothetical protein ACOX02_01690 [Acholeplasmatales bacterium]